MLLRGGESEEQSLEVLIKAESVVGLMGEPFKHSIEDFLVHGRLEQGLRLAWLAQVVLLSNLPNRGGHVKAVIVI